MVMADMVVSFDVVVAGSGPGGYGAAFQDLPLLSGPQETIASPA